jgi:hypothetical protein
MQAILNHAQGAQGVQGVWLEHNRAPADYVVLCAHGSMGVWEYGSMGVWEYGSMGVWEYGSMGVWEYGIWEYGP